MYFIWGEDQYLIDFNEKQIIKKIGLTPIVFNNLTNFLDIINEIKTISLFEDKKLIIIHNLQLLITSDSISIGQLLNSIEASGSEVLLLFTLNQPRLSMSNLLVKFLLENSEVIEAKKLQEKDVVPTIKKIVSSKNGVISNRAALKLAIILPNDLLIINNEISKLLLETNKIDENTVEISVAHYDKENVFTLSNAIVSGNSSEIIEAYYEKINNGVDPLLIIAQLASNYELAYLIQLYKKENHNIEQVAQILSIHIFRIGKIHQILEHELTYSIHLIIKRLAQLDYDIKTGKTKKNKGLDKFILDIIRH